MHGFREDVRYALRQVRLHPGLGLVIVLTLGGAIAVSTSVFSVFNDMWFRPWSGREPATLATVRPAVSTAEWEHWSRQSRSFRALVAMRSGGFARLGGRRATFDFVSAAYFETLGVSMARGRTFAAGDEAATSAILSHRTWETRFASDPEILGRTISLEGVPFVVVGVARRGFDGPDNIRKDLWLPLGAEVRSTSRPTRAEGPPTVAVAGLLASGVSRAEAQAELAALSRAFRSEHGQSAVPIRVRGTARYAYATPPPQTWLAWQSMLLGITFITFVACANIANLMLARGHARRREIAVRLALGATRVRLIRQLLVEAFVLAAAAGALGLVLSAFLPRLVLGLVPTMAEMASLDFHPDLRVAAWALAVATVACLAFGLMPALQCTRVSVSSALKEGPGVTAPPLKTSLLSWQAIVSVMSLVVAGLVVRSQAQVPESALARSFDGVVLVRLEFPAEYDDVRQGLVAAGLEGELRRRMGPHNVAAAAYDPRPLVPAKERIVAVSPGYFQVLRIPVVAGRAFDTTDAPDRVAIVNEALARREWADRFVPGRTLAFAGGGRREVVGVVRDGAVEPGTYAVAERHRVFVVREAGPALMRELVPLVARLDPLVRADVVSGSAWRWQSTGVARLGAAVAGGFGVFSLCLAAIGFFSLAHYAVRRKTREIGLRMALGAQPGDVLRAVFEPTVRALARGLVIGGVGGAGLGFFMARADLPAGVNPLDIVTYAGVALILAVAGLAAAYVPGRHAMRISPTEALRYE